MDDLEIRRYQMLQRVHDFGMTNAVAFPATSFGGQLFTTVNAAISELQSHAAVQSSGIPRERTTTKAVARANLEEDLVAMSRTARAMALEVPGLEDKFRLPRRIGDDRLMNAARAFLTDATPLKQEFVKFAMPEDFLDDLAADIAAFENAIATKNNAVSTRISATASIDEALARGMRAVQQLRAVVKNRFRNDAARLAAWTSASHVERPDKRREETPSEPPIPAPSAAPTSDATA